MANILLTTHWTDGDVIPFVRIGTILKQRGHKVTLFTHCHYEQIARDAHLDFVAWDTPERYNDMIFDMANYADTLAGSVEIQSFREKYEGIDIRLSEYAKIAERCGPEDTVIVAKNRSGIAALLGAEKFKHPIIYIYMNPYEMESILIFHDLFREELRKEANDLRSLLGLMPVDSWISWQCSPKVQLALWPKWFYNGSNEWLGTVDLVGFPVVSSEMLSQNTLSDDLQAIFDEDPSPLLITGGTSMQIKPEFYSSAISACEILGKKTILVTRYKEFVPDCLPPNITWFNYIHLDEIMSRIGAIIHHGGIGTVSSATYAATPQMILAYNVDRPMNGMIIKSLGIGEYLPPLRWDPKLIAEKITDLLQPEFKQKCLEFAQNLPQENALTTICEKIENIVGDSDFTISPSELPQESQNVTLSGSNLFSTQIIQEEKLGKLHELSSESREIMLKRIMKKNQNL